MIHRRGRFDHLRRIETLDPATDADEILRLTARYELPWDHQQGALVAAGLRLRAWYLRHLARPRRTAYGHRPTSYPLGYTHRDLRPESMLSALEATSRP